MGLWIIVKVVIVVLLKLFVRYSLSFVVVVVALLLVFVYSFLSVYLCVFMFLCFRLWVPPDSFIHSHSFIPKK